MFTCSGKFKKIPYFENHKKMVILQYDSQEKHRKLQIRLEIGNIKKIVGMLEKKLKSLSNEKRDVYLVDFSNSDLVEDELMLVVEMVKKFGVRYVNISDTHIEFVSDNQILDLSIDVPTQLAQLQFLNKRSSPLPPPPVDSFKPKFDIQLIIKKCFKQTDEKDCKIIGHIRKK